MSIGIVHVISEITMFSTVELLTSFREALERSPVEAAETSSLRDLRKVDRLFYKRLSAANRWRLVFGLGISLFNFSEGVDLNTYFLPLPGGLPSLSLLQICNSLVCADFQLDGLDWSKELEVQCPLTIAQLDACAALLSAPETLDRLDSLIAEGLSCIETCDEIPLQPSKCLGRPKGLLRRLRGFLHRMEE